MLVSQDSRTVGHVKAAIYTTCVMEVMNPDVGKAAVEVLERLGVETEVPHNQVCCGQPTYNSGYVKESMRTIRNQIDAFADAEVVVGLAGSCSGMFLEYPDLFDDGDPYRVKAKELVAKSYEFSQFIYRVLGRTDVGASFDPGTTATYHRSCHMSRILGETEAPYRLLDAVSGLEMIDLPNKQYCCGFGGTFSVKEPLISEAMVTEKANSVRDTGADILISADLGCLMNIGGKLNRDRVPIRLMHIAEVLNHRANWSSEGGRDE